MAKNLYIGVGGVARKGKEAYIGIDGKARKIKKMYIGVGGVARLFYEGIIIYTIKFNANGGSGSMSNLSMTYGTAKNLTANTFTRTGYTFQGWSTSSSATSATYTDGQSVNNLTSINGGTVNLYAVWKANTYAVRVLMMSGAQVGGFNVTYDSMVTLPSSLSVSSSYVIMGYNTDRSNTVEYTLGQTISANELMDSNIKILWVVTE